ncbi:type I-E CRISPR-associated protein Cse1/CasA [candidate division FCPU426 bacterium]|nr:type I-E CRISPR-associated protein Cse1/CasA [candidate division FCPU426 bacterium]
MSRFNLIDEKWIPVRMRDGTRDELGIKDTLLRSKEIAGIEDQSPLVVAALYRFLLAVLYRALEGPTDIKEAKDLFKAGLSVKKIKAYLEKWWERFYLFDKKYPFGQNPNVSESEIEPWTKLTSEYNASSNKVLFDHTDAKDPGIREPKECARWLLSTMTFSISGGRGYYPSPSPNAMMCIPLGENLHETLCYNLVHYPNRKVMEMDSALWERKPKSLPLKKPKQTASGYADLYTWLPRMVLFEEHASGNVESMRFVAGIGFDNPSENPDPMQPYKNDDKYGRMPIQFREDKGTWRDFDSLLPDSETLAPLTIQNALQLAGSKTERLPKSLLVLGLRYSPPSANVDFWRMERFTLPEALASDRVIRTEIHQLLEEAQETQTSLWSSCCTFARHLLRRGEKEPDNKDVKAFVKQIPIIAWYWSTLETRFHEVLSAYTLDRNPDDIRCQWLKYIRDSLRSAWEQHRASVSMGDAWAIRAVVKAEKPVRRKLKELNDEILKLEPQKEGA